MIIVLVMWNMFTNLLGHNCVFYLYIDIHDHCTCYVEYVTNLLGNNCVFYLYIDIHDHCTCYVEYVHQLIRT